MLHERETRDLGGARRWVAMPEVRGFHIDRLMGAGILMPVCICGHKQRAHISFGRRACVICMCSGFQIHKLRDELHPRWLAYPVIGPEARPGCKSMLRDLRFLLFVAWLVIRREIILDRPV